MRVVLVVHKCLPNSLGGTEVYADQLARYLAQHHEVFVFSRDDSLSTAGFAESTTEYHGYPLHRVSSHRSGVQGSPLHQFLETFQNAEIEAAFRAFLARIRPELVHFQHVMALSADLIRIARERGLPVVVTVHDYWFMCSNSQLIWPDRQTCQGKAGGRNCVRCATVRFRLPLLPVLSPAIAPLFVYRDRTVRRAVLLADRLIAPSRFLIQQYVEYGLPSDRFVYLENGIDVERIRRFPRQPGSEPLRVTYIGSIAWQKGVHVLAEAFGDISPEQAALRVYGDPGTFPDYTRSLEPFLHRPNVRLCGRVANEEVGRILAESDVVVVPSLWYENSPVVIQEAFAAGVPVVASRLGALAEKVRHRENGLLFQAGDTASLRRTLLTLAEDRALLARLTANIEPPVSWVDNGRAVWEIYQQLARPARSAG